MKHTSKWRAALPALLLLGSFVIFALFIIINGFVIQYQTEHLYPSFDQLMPLLIQALMFAIPTVGSFILVEVLVPNHNPTSTQYLIAVLGGIWIGLTLVMLVSLILNPMSFGRSLPQNLTQLPNSRLIKTVPYYC